MGGVVSEVEVRCNSVILSVCLCVCGVCVCLCVCVCVSVCREDTSVLDLRRLRV